MLRSTLSAEELERSRKFRFERDRAHFVASRWLLRHILGNHLGITPASVQFIESPGDKPRVTQAPDGPTVNFSLARSSGTTLIGVTRGREIGIDLEHVRNRLDIESMVPIVFSKRELEFWATTRQEHRRELFFTAWTRKEALGKAEGCGISEGPDAIDVPLECLRPNQWICIDGLQPSSRWMMSSLVPGPETLGCIVVETLPSDPLCGRYDDIPVTTADKTIVQALPDAKLFIRRFRSI